MFQCGMYVCPGTHAEETVLQYHTNTVVPDEIEDTVEPESPVPPYDDVNDHHHQQHGVLPSESDGTPPPADHDESTFEHDQEIEEQMIKFLQQVTLKTESATGEENADEDGVVEERGLDIQETCTSIDETVQMTEDAASTQLISEKDIDLDFVEEYDHAFNEFVTRNPRFLISNPNLMHHVRVIKLQKMLEGQDRQESSIQNQLDKITERKKQVELGWQEQLRDAAGKKAARETHLQSYLGNINYNTKCMEAQLTWHLICDAQHCIKKEHLLRTRLNQKQGEGDGRLDLLKALPEGSDFDDLRNAMLAPAGETLSEEQEKDLRQFQMDNAFLAAEVAVLRKKLAYQKATTKRHAWVESVLLRLDESSARRLKARFQKTVGVPL
jgi:hypothetical protein